MFTARQMAQSYAALYERVLQRENRSDECARVA
jgi:hypothetical protein